MLTNIGMGILLTACGNGGMDPVDTGGEDEACSRQGRNRYGQRHWYTCCHFVECRYRNIPYGTL